MRKLFWLLLCCCICTLSVKAESFLTARKFPKTFEDLSFKSQIEFKTADYELIHPEYDAAGFCIKNCAYPGINIKQEEKLSDINTEAAVKKSKEYEKVQLDTPNEFVDLSDDPYFCLARNPNIPVGQKIPYGEPVTGFPHITSPYGPRNLFGRSFHYGIDYGVPQGTNVYSTADGKVSKVIKDSICGNGLKIEHKDGTKTIYCHLSQTLVKQGTLVGAGCLIAKSGNTGESTGPHLHYGIRDSNNRDINPSPYTGRAR